MISFYFATRNRLERISIKSRSLIGFESLSKNFISEVAVISIDIDGYYKEKAYFYIVPKLASYDLILGMPWIIKQDVRLNAPRSEIYIRSTGTIVQNKANQAQYDLDCNAISVVAFNRLSRRRKCQKTEIFAVSLADINKAL